MYHIFAIYQVFIFPTKQSLMIDENIVKHWYSDTAPNKRAKLPYTRGR